MEIFDKKLLKKLYKAPEDSNGEDNGQITIIGGSKLFHGAPLLSLRTASRIVDMVFFSSPFNDLEKVSDYIKAELSSFIWVPFSEIEEYVKKSDAILIGPGFMRYHNEKDKNSVIDNKECDEACEISRSVTHNLLTKFKDKKWVVDAGSLQTMDPRYLPENAIITPNLSELNILFNLNIKRQKGKISDSDINLISEISNKQKIIIVLKGVSTLVFCKSSVVEVLGGTAGLTKGGTGDVQAGLTASLLSKNDPFLAAMCASYIVKYTAEQLSQKIGIYFNSDDLADAIPQTMASLLL